MGAFASILLALPLSLVAGWIVAALIATSVELGQGTILVMLPVVVLLFVVWLALAVPIVLGVTTERFRTLAVALGAASLGLTLTGFAWLLLAGKPPGPGLREWVGLIASLMGLGIGVLVQWLCLRRQAI
jgi:hypothetical protein